jgi:Spy/CpxP family protein refolding chaperone
MCAFFSDFVGGLIMKSGMYGLKLAVAICVVATTVAAMAQGQGRRGGGFGFGGRGGGMGNDPTFLLSIEPVQKELELSADQKTQVQKLADDAQQARMDLFQSGASREEMQTKMQDLAKANKKKADDILLVPQRDRLDEISLQFALSMSAPSALARDDIASKLTLTDDQKTKLTAQTEENQQKMRDLFQGGGPPDQQEMAKMRTEQTDKAIAVLTADQKDKLEKMKGKKFDIDPMAMFRGGFGGRRGGQNNN